MSSLNEEDMDYIVDYDKSISHTPVTPLDIKNRKLETTKRKCRLLKKSYIRNTTKSCAYIYIADGPISYINKIKVDHVGELELLVNGDDKVQEFRVAPGIEREIMLGSHTFYFTIYLNIEYRNRFNVLKNEWRLLYKNRKTSCSHNINIIPRNVREVMMTNIV